MTPKHLKIYHSSSCIPKAEAEEIIKSVKDALKDWQKVAKRLGAQERDINLFSQRFITE